LAVNLSWKNEKASEIIRGIFNLARQNFHAVNFCRPRRRNRGAVHNILFFDHFNAAGCVVGRDYFAAKVPEE